MTQSQTPAGPAAPPGDDEPAGLAGLPHLWLAPAAGAVFVLGLTLGGGAASAPGLAGAAGLAFVAWWLRRTPAERPRAVTAGERGRAERVRGEILVLSAFPDPALLVAPDQRLLAMNGPAEDLLGAHRPGIPFSFAIRAPQVSEAVRSARAGSGPVRVTYTAKVPDDRLLEAHVAQVTSESNQAAGVLIVLRDLTGQQRLERMRSDFVANASHELRTPLASVMGFIETLQGPARNDEAARERFLAIMAAQAARMSRLIDDLMSLSRIEQKAHLRPSGRVDLVRTIAHVVDALQPIAGEDGVDIRFDTAGPGEEFTVTGEADELMQVFQNLIENAIKYGASGKRVEIALERAPAAGGQSARILAHVRDFGPGIEPEHLPRLTERFYRADVATSRERGGTGLGLAIVKHILNRHRASLSVDSRVGQGAVFTVGFPLPQEGK